MAKTVQIGPLTIGAGIPKIVAPLLAPTRNQLLAEARSLRQLPVDMAEWRADWFLDATKPEAVLETLQALREALGDMPLLFTVRTKGEGGALDLSEKEYARLIRTAANSGEADLVDVELSFSPGSIGGWIRSIHQAGARVIVSHHNFQRTPPEQELLSLLEAMQRTEADLLKLAVMPASADDVLALLSATNRFAAVSDRPLVTMSMGALGAVSRLSGEIFGSAMTFATAQASSAPGQLPAVQLAGALQLLHPPDLL